MFDDRFTFWMLFNLWTKNHGEISTVDLINLWMKKEFTVIQYRRVLRLYFHVDFPLIQIIQPFDWNDVKEFH